MLPSQHAVARLTFQKPKPVTSLLLSSPRGLRCPGSAPFPTALPLPLPSLLQSQWPPRPRAQYCHGFCQELGPQSCHASQLIQVSDPVTSSEAASLSTCGKCLLCTLFPVLYSLPSSGHSLSLYQTCVCMYARTCLLLARLPQNARSTGQGPESVLSTALSQGLR